MKSKSEMVFTSTTTKLLHNIDRLIEIQSGIFRPISIQLAPTDKCNLKCDFCSVANREMRELTFKQCEDVLNTFKLLGAKTIEITGGGDPTMYRHINELILNAHYLGFEVGMITNGVILNKSVSLESLSKLMWLRISLNSLDYVNEVNLDVPKNVTLGFSYVWNDRSNRGMLDKIIKYMNKYNAAYVRVVPDCLNVNNINRYKKIIDSVIGTEHEKMFVQQKEYIIPSRCWMGYLKPFVNSDGWIYHCSANPLINRKFHPNFRMGKIEDINEIWSCVKPFNTSNCVEGKCFFAEHNNLIEQVIMDVPHKNFI